MLCTIEDQYFPRHGFGCNQIWILRHVSRTVDLSVMVDFLDDLYPWCRGKCVATQFAAFIVIVSPIKFIGTRCWVVAFGDLDGRNLEVVLCLSRFVRSK